MSARLRDPSAPTLTSPPTTHVSFAREVLHRLASRRLTLAALSFLGMLAIVALFAPSVAPFDPQAQDISLVNAPPSRTHWLGTDDVGRDVLSRIIFGARVSLASSLVAVGISLAFAVPVGLIAGYAGGRLDRLLMRIVEGIQSIPPLILAMAIAGILGPSLRNIVVALAVIFAPTFIRLVRGQALAIREETFIEASRSVGAPAAWIIRRRVLHNLASPLIVQASITLGLALLAEAGLSFLGLGVQPPAASWGSMLSRAYAAIFDAPWQIFFPGVAIAATVLAFNLVGDGLRDAFGTDRTPGRRSRRSRTAVSTLSPGAAAATLTEPVPTDALLVVHGLTVDLAADAGPVRLLDDVGFHVRRGETLGLVGESGAGKSLTSLALTRLLPPRVSVTAGSVLLEGRELTRLPERDLRRVRGAEIAMIFQDPMTSMNPAFTVGDQIAEMLRVHRGSGRREAQRRAIELLDLVGIPEPDRRVHDYPHAFSGGMRQRAMIAMALACEPKLLIADEPTTALDVTIQAEILDLLQSLRERFSMSMIFVTHDLAVVSSMCDRVCVMYAGQVVEEASAGALFGRPGHPYTEGLLRSMPRTVARGQRLRVIPGVIPSPEAPPPGCRFAPRCPYRVDVCEAAVPDLVTPGHGERVRCTRVGELELGGAR